MGNQFAVENRTGAAARLPPRRRSMRRPTAIRLLFAGPTVTISASLYKKLNAVDQLSPVGLVARAPTSWW